MTQLIQTKTEQSIIELSKPSLAKFLPYLLMDWIAIAAGFSLFAIYPSVITFLLASIVIGIAQHALFILGHEAVHYSMAKNRTVSEWIGGLFCLFPIGLTVSKYREFHFAHHRNVNTEEDPEVPLRRKISQQWGGPYNLTRAFKLWALSFVGYSLKDQLIIMTSMPKGNKAESVALLAYLAVVGFVAYKTNHLLYLALWQFSLATSYLSSFRIETWYEHTLDTQDANRYQIPNPLFRLLVPHNIWVHYEHHKYPSAPFYNLERIRLLDPSEKIYAFKEMIAAIENPANAQPSAQTKQAA
jgi:fatty acid desaturase